MDSAPSISRVGERLRQLRKACGVSQIELAERLHKSQSAISDYEGGRIRIDADMLPEMAAILHVPITAFFDEVAVTENPRDRARRRLIEDFLTWRSATIGAEGSHSLVFGNGSAREAVPEVFLDTFHAPLDPSPAPSDGIPTAA